jgi:hypothetical protein
VNSTLTGVSTSGAEGRAVEGERAADVGDGEDDETEARRTHF